MVKFHGMVRLHLSTAVTPPITVRTRSYSSWKLSGGDVLSVFVRQLLEGSQATAETQDSVGIDAVIRQVVGSLLQAVKSLLEHVPPGHPSGCKVVLENLRLVVIAVENTVQAFVCEVKLTEARQAALTANPLAAPVHVAEGPLARHALLSRELLANELCAAVGHGLQAAGADHVAALKGAGVLLRS